MPRRLSGAGKLCAPRAIFHQVITKTGTVASPALRNADVRRRERAIDRTRGGEVFANGFDLKYNSNYLSSISCHVWMIKTMGAEVSISMAAKGFGFKETGEKNEGEIGW